MEVNLNLLASLATLFVTGGMLIWMLNNQFQFSKQIARMEGQLIILLELFKKLDDITKAKMTADACHKRLDDLKKREDNVTSQH